MIITPKPVSDSNGGPHVTTSPNRRREMVAIANSSLTSSVSWMPLKHGTTCREFASKRSLTILLTMSMLLLLPKLGIAAEPTPLCREFQKILATRAGLARYALEAIVDDRRIKRIPNVDIDGDDVSDEVRWSCADGGSSIPVDPCSMAVQLSSSKRTIEFEQLRFYLIRFRAKVYVVSSTDLRHQEDVDKTNIYTIDRSGIKLVCERL